MRLKVSPEVMRGMYDYLSCTLPFSRMKLPHSSTIKFVVDRQRDTSGWYRCDDGQHVIGVSERNVGTTTTLSMIIAHEMLHLYQRVTKTDHSDSMHNAAFIKLAQRTCEIHGWDPKQF